MTKVLVVVDMQNDFIDGALGTAEAVEIVDYVTELVRDFDGDIIFTRDTHGADYLSTQEGAFLPIEHCVKGTAGWEICTALSPYAEQAVIIDKPSFGSTDLVTRLQLLHDKEAISEITLVGLCTDICVVTNALLIKTALPEVPVLVIASACAGVSVAKHEAALETMRSCQVLVV